jgi:hemoglobin/transferrin/lactoferrin receptor protein
MRSTELRISSFVVLFAAIFLFAITGLAQSGLTIIVKDPNGAVVPGAEVTISGKGVLSRARQTDRSGNADFDGVQPGEILVVVEADSFPRTVRSISFSGGHPVEIVLTPGGVSESVTVTAARTQISADDSTSSVSVIDRLGIERRSLNSIGDLFRSLAGTSTNNEGAFQVRPRVRGLESNRVLILIDGDRLNNSRTSTGQSGIEIGLVEPSLIQSVEVVRGSGSVLYGTDALAGTINIITADTPARRESGFRFGGALNTFYTSNENGRRGSITLNGASKWFAFGITQSLERFENYFVGKADGAVPPDILAIGGITTDGEVLNSQSHGGNTRAMARFFLNDANTLRFNYDRRRMANIGSPTLFGTFTGYFPFSNRDKFSARYDVVELTENLKRVSISAYYQPQLRNFTNVLTVPSAPPFFPGLYQFSETITDTKTVGFDIQTDWRLGHRNFMIAGVSFFRDKNTDRRSIITSTTPTSPNRTIRNSQSVPNASLSNFGLFAQNEFRITPKVRIVGGIRFDTFATRSEPTPEFTLDPRFTEDQIEDLGLTGLTDGLDVTNQTLTGDIGVVYSPIKEISLTGRIGRSFRTPNIFERFFTDFGSVGGFLVGNPHLEPEAGINVDTNFRYRSDRIAVTLTYFNNTYSNFLALPQAVDRNGDPIVIPRPPLAPIPVFQTQNVRKARIQGVEAEFEAPIKISFGYLTPYGNYSYLRGDDLTENQPLDTISPHRTNAGFRWENFRRSYFMDYNVRIVTTQHRLPPLAFQPVTQGGNGGPEPGFVTHNLSGGYYYRGERYRFNINLGVSNLLNRAYNEQFVFAPARGRSFTIGTTWELR